MRSNPRNSCPRQCSRTAGLRGLSLAVAFYIHAASAGEIVQIPLIVGLTTTSAVSDPAGDYETLAVIEELGPRAYRLTLSAEAPDDSGEVREITVSRNVRLQDLQLSHTLRRYFHETDPEEFPGTTPEFSSAMINELRATGKTTISVQDVEASLFSTVVKRTYRGMLAAVGSGVQELAILVNGQLRPLHAWHISARLNAGADSDDFDFWVLDDPANPLLLRAKGPVITSSILRIDFPVRADAGNSIEHSLAEQKRALVYGIYFKFAHADIRPQSEGTLKQIAVALKNNPEWHLSIVGHTDNVGGDAANLELSRRRAAAVKAALIERYGISVERLTSTGYGASQPQEKNDTPQGRARNRRVELIRT
jgi:outer membrane protein OmpA-like peptidoglycan-associated protein